MSRAQGFRAGISLFETIAGPKHWMLGTCARARVVLLAWHHGMGDIEHRERERLRFLLQERKVQMVVLLKKRT